MDDVLHLAIMHRGGLVTQVNQKAACQLFQKKAQMGTVVAMYNVALILKIPRRRLKLVGFKL